MLKCLIAFILGWLASRCMGNGNGYSVGGFGHDGILHGAERETKHDFRVGENLLSRSVSELGGIY